MSSQPQYDLFSTRKILMQSAYVFIYTKGWTREEWENDESVLSFAAEHNLQSELTHFSALGAAGFSKGT
jgi:hypothetical protein